MFGSITGAVRAIWALVGSNEPTRVIIQRGASIRHIHVSPSARRGAILGSAAVGGVALAVSAATIALTSQLWAERDALLANQRALEGLLDGALAASAGEGSTAPMPGAAITAADPVDDGGPLGRVQLIAHRLDACTERYGRVLELTSSLVSTESARLLTRISKAGIDLGRVDLTPLKGATGGDLQSGDLFQELTDLLGAAEASAILRQRALREHVRSWPVISPMVDASQTSSFGMRRHPITGSLHLHGGIDFVGDQGSEIIATAEGRVRSAGPRGNYGLAVEIVHPNGFTTLYAHLNSISVRPGQPVARRDVLGIMGSTGLSTGPHLHYEIHYRGQRVDPAVVMGVIQDVPPIQTAGR